MSDIASETLTLLERRLACIESLPRGYGESIESQALESESVNTQLSRLETKFADICSQSPIVTEVLRLNAGASKLLNSNNDLLKDEDLSISSKLQILLSTKTLLPSTASRLSELQSQKMPDAGGLTALLGLQARLVYALQVQAEQAQEVEDLRVRSATVLLDWYRKAILRGGEQWTGWEQQLAGVEQIVRRKEHARSREESQT